MSQYTKFFLLPNNFLNVTASSNLSALQQISGRRCSVLKATAVFLISLETKYMKHVCIDCSQPLYCPQFKHKIAVRSVSESFLFTTIMLKGTYHSSKNSDVQQLTQDVTSHNIHTKGTGEMQELIILDELTSLIAGCI